MVNIFGKDSVQGKRGDRGPIGPKGSSGARGPVGKRGRSGRDGIVDLYNWMPSTLLQNFQVDSEECCFLIRKGENNVRRNKKGDIISWKSKSIAPSLGSFHKQRKNAISRNDPIKSITYTSDDRGYLTLEKSLLGIQRVVLTNSYTFVCATFKLSNESDNSEQYILSNWQANHALFVFRGISATKDTIYIHGCVNGEKDRFPIKHDTTKWTTIFIEWCKNDKGSYDINKGKKTGTFHSKHKSDFLASTAYIGAKSDKSHYFKGNLAAIEWASFMHSKTNNFPDFIKDLIIENQYIEEYDTELSPPSSKIRKLPPPS